MIRFPHKKINPQFRYRKMLKWVVIGLVISVLFYLMLELVFLRRPVGVERSLNPSERDIVQREKLNAQIDEILFKYGIREEWISLLAAQRNIRIPKTVPIVQLCQEIATAAKANQIEIWKSDEDLKTGTITLDLGYQSKLLQSLKFIKDESLTPAAGKIALIIDDFGNSLGSVVDGFLNLPIPFTISVIPGLKYTPRVAELALLHQKEILIHLPMEPQAEKIFDNGYTILTTAPDSVIRQRIQAAMHLIPGAAGLNNHQGSKAMTDPRVVTILLQELKQRKLFLIDSKTIANSLGVKLAHELGVPAANRDVFLDHVEDEADIRAQLFELARKSRSRKVAIGIGHVKARTLAVIEAMYPELQRLGYEFVLVSEVFKPAYQVAERTPHGVE